MGKIKKILENELLGGTTSSDVYPITSTQAVYTSENNKLSDSYVKDVSCESNEEDVSLILKRESGTTINTITIPVATTKKAGVMTAEDKRVLDKVADDIEKKQTVVQVEWVNEGNVSNMNDFVVAGVYDIKGERTRIDDNLPILNIGGGHTFNARLTVLNSSITGSGKDDDKCITQVLSFSNRLGQGEVYIRTGKGASLDNLTWEKWSTLQRNVNVGEVETLDSLIDNGIYSGVLITTGEMFVLVVINNYAVVGNNMPRSISQFKYSVSINGTASFAKRVKVANWADWEILNQKEINSMIEEAVIAAANYTDTTVANAVAVAIQKILEGVDPDKIDSLKDIISWIDGHGGDAAAMLQEIQQNTVKINAEISRAQAKEKELNDLIDLNYSNIIAEEERAVQAENEIKAKAINVNTLHFETSADNVTLSGKAVDGNATLAKSIPAATIETAGVMSAADKKALDEAVSDIVGINDAMTLDREESVKRDNDIKANAMQYNTLGVATYADKAEIFGRSINTDVRVVEFPAATTESAGVMTAEDKNKLNTLSSYTNMECASRASISYNNSTKTLTIGTGYMYFYNGKGIRIDFTNSATYTYTFTGSRVVVFDTVAAVITDRHPDSALTTDIWLLWYDGGGGGLAGGVLYNYVNNADLTKKIRYNNMEVVSRAAVSYNSSTKTISIGSGKIFCYNSNTRVEINLTTPYEYTFTGSATIVYNTADETITKRDPTAVRDYDIVLLWYDGTKGLHAGLLYRYVKEEADNAKEQNPPLDKKISAGAVILDNLVVGVPVYIQVRLTGTSCGIGVYDADGNRKKILKNRTAGKAGEVESVLYVIEEGDAKIKELGWSSLYLDYVLYLDASSYTTREGVVNQEKYINTQIAASLDTPIKSIIHGGTGSYPQNNLVLYKNAAQKGMLFWECDVRPCADGYVLSHDDDMYQLALDADGNQLTQGDWLCSQKTVAELKTLRTGIKKGVYSIVKGYENATVATLEEFIVLAKVYGACPVIEIKFTATEAQIREIYSIVKRHGMVGRSLFLLYGNRALHGQYFHAIDENANLVFCGEGSIAASDLDAIISYKNDRNVMGLSYFIKAYTDEVLNKALDAGLLIGTWSATSSSNIVSLVNKGYSMFTIDDMTKNSVTTLRSLI